MNLDWENANDNLVSIEIIEKLRNFQNIIIFGAGQSGEWVNALLRSYGIIPKCFCDNSKLKIGMIKDGMKVFSFEEVMAQYENPAFCIASMWGEEIRKQIENFDIHLAKHTWNLLTTMSWETIGNLRSSDEPEYIRNNLEEYENLYRQLVDKQSKETLEGLLNYRLTRDDTWLKKIKSSGEVYLDRDIFCEEDYHHIKQNEIIDGGAFDGDTIEQFIKCFKDACLYIHCWEAERKNCKIIREKASGWIPNKVVVHEAALWNKSNEVLQFSGEGLSGSINLNGEYETAIRTECIDDCEYNKVGYIKMDIEGAEREALEGARKTIERDKPILAICSYHMQDDLVVLPQIISSFNCRYRIYLRHYMCSAGDTILYAIPEKAY